MENSNNTNYLFLAIDTYSHIKRNFLGFKNRKGITEQRPCTLTIVSSSDGMMDTDGIFVSSFKGAKIKDDPEYVAKPIDPAYYGHPISEYEVYDNIQDRLWASAGLLLVHDNSMPSFNSFMHKHESAIGEIRNHCKIFSQFIRESIHPIPTSYFIKAMEGGTLESHINIDADGNGNYPAIPLDLKYELFRSHIRYPKFLDTDRSLSTAIKMNEAYSLIQLIKKHL